MHPLKDPTLGARFHRPVVHLLVLTAIVAFCGAQASKATAKDPARHSADPDPLAVDAATLIRANKLHSTMDVTNLQRSISERPAEHSLGLRLLAEDMAAPTPQRLVAIRLLRYVPDNNALSTLIAASMGARHPSERSEAIQSLATRTEAAAIRRLEAIASSRADPARELSISLLGKTQSQSSLSILLASLSSASEEVAVRNAAAYALHRYRSDEVVSLLIGQFANTSNSTRVRATAIWSLGKLGSYSALAQVKEALNSSTREIRFSGATAAQSINDAELQHALVARMLDTSEFLHVRQACSRALSGIADEISLARIRKAIATQDGFGITLICHVCTSRGDKQSVAELLMYAENTSDAHVRAEILECVKSIGGGTR